jgi:PKD repeat protein
VAVDNYENIYVTESVYNKLLIYSHNNQYKGILTGLNRPISVAVDVTGRIFIGNYYDNLNDKGNVEVYDADLNLLFKLGVGDGEFSQPNSISIDSSSGNVYVVDTEDDTVKVYNSDGSFYFSFDGTTNGGGHFEKPLSIVIDEISEEVIVLDRPLTGNSTYGARIQFFDMSGGFNSGFSKYGMDVGEMFKPQHLTVDKEGRIYVTDTQHNVVLVYEKDSTYLGALYDQYNPMRTPMGITIGDSNRLYIVSLILRKVEVYGISPYIQMEVSPLSILFEGQSGGANPALQEVEISNNGTGTLNWTAVTNDSWITLSDAAGSAVPSSVSTLDVGTELNGLTAGTYIGSIRISSESGATEIVNVEIAVSDSPLIAIPGGPYAGTEGQMVLFDGSNSTGNITLYDWDVDNNGTYEYSNPLPIQGHVYTQIGTYFLRLKVTNDLVETDEALTIVEISDASPTADFTGTPTAGAAQLTVNFTNSSTGYDQPLAYEWDFDNDGTTDSTDENPSYTYSDVGSYTVKLTVRDSDGSINILTRGAYITVTSEGSSSCENSPIRIDSEEYSTLQAAYDTAVDGDVIMVRAESFTESLNIMVDITAILQVMTDKRQLMVT